MAKTTVLFGNSYVKRLREFCSGRLHVPGDVYWYGRGGLRTDRMDYRLYDRMLRKRPQIAVINIGGNDITPTSAPRDISSEFAISWRICMILV